MCELVSELVKTPDGIEVSYDSRLRLKLVPDGPWVPVIREDMVHDHIVPNNPLGRGGECGHLSYFLLIGALLAFSEMFFLGKHHYQNNPDEEYGDYYGKKEVFHEYESVKSVKSVQSVKSVK